MKVWRVWKIWMIAVIAAVAGGVMLWFGTLDAEARDLDELIDRKPNQLTTSYYPEHRVFCATRMNAVSCVVAPKYAKGWQL